MKWIIEECRTGTNAPLDIIKLRLRGQGSGYKEGHLKRESSEPLHLCVSSQYFDKFQIACEQAELLLTWIYKEYNSYCKKQGKKFADFKIKKVQNVPAQAIQASLLSEESKFDEFPY